MRLFTDQATLDAALSALQILEGPRCSLVSAEVPLISNLDVCRNIALIYQYHRDASKKYALDFVRQCLQRFGLERIAHKKNPELSNEERFYVMLLRAAMIERAVIAIDCPFRMLLYNNDRDFIYEALEKIDDLFVRCEIFDYDQEKQKNGLIHDSKN